jgi:hypothetical protein
VHSNVADFQPHSAFLHHFFIAYNMVRDHQVTIDHDYFIAVVTVLNCLVHDKSKAIPAVQCNAAYRSLTGDDNRLRLYILNMDQFQENETEEGSDGATGTSAPLAIDPTVNVDDTAPVNTVPQNQSNPHPSSSSN